MMYFFKTLACFYLLKVQVLHMALYIKVEGVLHFPLKGLYQKMACSRVLPLLTYIPLGVHHHHNY